MPQTVMSEATVRTLAAMEYDLIALSTDIGTLAERLERCADSKRAPLAARRLRALDGALCNILSYLDVEVTAAAQAVERLSPPPF